MITWTPQSIAFHVGPIPVFWYGIAYAVGLFVAYGVLVRQARVFRQDPEIIANSLIVIAIAALIGGRAYHVIDQWQLYKDDLVRIVLPPYSGLGVYGGLVTGIIAFVVLVRYHRVNPWIWADIVAPALFTMQAVGRWGNFFNQELYGPPTSLPWGIAIDCAHRVAAYPCSAYPEATTFFTPLFLYESISGLLGLLFLVWLSGRRPYPLRAGDQVLIFFIWYSIVRFLLENLRTGNWTLDGIPTAQIMAVLFALGSFLVLVYRHRRPMPPGDEAGPSVGPSHPDRRSGDDLDDLDDLDPAGLEADRTAAEAAGPNRPAASTGTSTGGGSPTPAQR